MRPLLLLFPFLALFALTGGLALGSLFASIPWIAYIGWTVAGLLLGAWVTLDWAAFKRAWLRRGARYGASRASILLLTCLCLFSLAMLSNRPRFDRSFDWSGQAL